MNENKTKEQDLYLAQETTVGNGVAIVSGDVRGVAMTAAAGGNGTWDATPLTLGRWTTSELCCFGQEHWYSFTANNTTVQTDGTTNWYRIQGGGFENVIGRLYNASGHLIGFSNSGPSFDMTIQLTHGAKYYVCITHNSSVGSVYDVRVKAVAAPSSEDCVCDEFASAMSLTLNTWKSGNIYVAGSSVYYRFVPSTTAYYTIETSGSVDTVVYLLDANGNQLTSNDNGGSTGYNFRISYRLVAGRSYYIRVTGYGTSVGGFSIVVKGSVYVSSVSVSPSSATLSVGQTRTLTATVYPSNATNKSYVWSSNNTGVATVSSSGVVTARGGGTATIYATAQDGSGVFGYCRVTVPIRVTSINVSPAATTLYVGQCYAPAVNVYPYNATNQMVTWMSCDPTIATVDYYSGCITARSAGTTTVVATSSDGSYTDSIQVTVNPLLVYQTRDTEVKWFSSDEATEEEIRPDLHWNHMSKSQIIESISHINNTDFEKFVIEHHDGSGSYYPKVVADYKNSFLSMATTWFANNEFDSIITDMIEHFMGENDENFTGAIDGYSVYENASLTEKVKTHFETEAFFEKTRIVLDGCLKDCSGRIDLVQYDPCKRFLFNERKNELFVAKADMFCYNLPVFDSSSDNTTGYTICLDSLHGGKVEIISYTLSGRAYSGTMLITYYDHFGLDVVDMTGNYGFKSLGIRALSGFTDWFILQHCNELGTGIHPKPFVTKMTFQIPFSGYI